MSAGVLLYRRLYRQPNRRDPSELQVLLGHPGGPFWARKDAGAWSIPKGEYQPDEEAFAAAQREFTEELGAPPPEGDYVDLGAVIQAGGKQVTVWAVQGDFDPATATSNTIEVQWPPRSGRRLVIPELDRVEWFGLAEARSKLVAGQVPFLDRLLAALAE